MKLKLLILVIIFFSLNIMLVESQEGKCPPDCSSASKISDESYTNTESYKNDDFYRNSNPKKWNLKDPNFAYPKIPKEKYPELPYDSPNLDHSKLDPQKYICARGCCTCTLRIATTEGIQYSTDGVLHPRTGFANIPHNYPRETLFIATPEGIFVVLPEFPSKDLSYRIDPLKTGNVVLITNGQNVLFWRDPITAERVGIRDGQLYVPSNTKWNLRGIDIKSTGNEVFVYFDGISHKGNYVSLGKNNFIADGNKFDLEFSTANKYVRVFGDPPLTQKESIENRILISRMEDRDLLWQDDYLYFSLGDGKEKNGRFELFNKENYNDLSILKTDGYIRMWNDRNDVTIDGKNFWSRYYQPYFVPPGFGQGSVSMQLIADDDSSKLWTFDENRRIFPLTTKQAAEIGSLRSEILKNHNIILHGFFDLEYLSDFNKALFNMEKSLGTDFREVERVKGKKIEVIEGDKRLSKKSIVASTYVGENQVFFAKDFRIGEPYRISAYTLADQKAATESEPLTHEVGHLLTSEDLLNKFRTINAKYDIRVSEYSGKSETNPVGFSPTSYGKTDIREFAAELFATLTDEKEWFTSVSQHVKDQPFWNQLGKDAALKYRTELRAAWEEEIRKYQKQGVQKTKNP